MSITVPSTEVVGLFNDVIPFALDDKDYPGLCCVRVEWDGEMLHLQATDGTHMAWSRWHPGDDPDGDAQESMLEPWGGDDDPWTAVITLQNAKDLAKMFKVSDKHFWAPMAVGLVARTGALRVARNRVPGLMGIDTTVEPTGAGHEFPVFEEMFAKLDRPAPVDKLAFSATQLAHFGTVRPRGPMELTFNGPRGAALVAIGERFTGAVAPVRAAAERHLQAAA